MGSCELSLRLGEPVVLSDQDLVDPEVTPEDIENFNRSGNCFDLSVKLGTRRCDHFLGEAFLPSGQARSLLPKDVTHVCPVAVKARSLPGAD